VDFSVDAEGLTRTAGQVRQTVAILHAARPGDLAPPTPAWSTGTALAAAARAWSAHADTLARSVDSWGTALACAADAYLSADAAAANRLTRPSPTPLPSRCPAPAR
jgi:hypothetical protein